jgi:error-prone DNA polymerase
MPEQPSKSRPHPSEFYRHPMLRSLHGAERGEEIKAKPAAPSANSAAQYAELHVTSNFTFLTGASHPDELVEQAASLGHHAIALTDVNSLAGVVRAHIAAKEAGVQCIVGCRIEMEHEPLQADLKSACRGSRLSVLVFPTDIASYGRLCRLLTLGKRRAPKGECHFALHDLLDHHKGLLAVVIPPHALDQLFLEVVEGLRCTFDDDRLSIAASCLYGEDDRERLAHLAALSEHTGVPLVATNDVHYHVPERRPLQDVLTCIRHGCTIEEAGFRLFPNAERCLKPPEEMARLFADHPKAIRRTIEIAKRSREFSLDHLRYQYPDEVCPPGVTPMRHLTALTWAGADERYPHGVPAKVRSLIERELGLIDELNYARYFLTVHDLVVFARSRGILCQGRGAAANSAVCYCLAVTSVDPGRIDLLFERFISKDRNEPPDIDIDFEHERREEVIQYLYGKYGRDRAALTAEVITYRGRSAVREVGKAMGLSLDLVDRLAKDIDWWSDQVNHSERLRAMGLDPADPTIRNTMRLAWEILGFPRHLSQHVGGFVITRGPLCEMVPVENARMEDRTVIEWDKDDIDAMGMMKVDVLGLGMLTCVRKAFELIHNAAGDFASVHDRPHSRSRKPRRSFAKRPCLSDVPPEDPAVYDMICKADTVGVFQIESRAQMQMLPRLRPRCFYDLVIEVAIVRPGPIQGDMVHPYLRRRSGREPVRYPSEDVKRVLGKTLGVPLFQEQAMALAIVAAGFTPGEADQLRRAMAAWKRKGDQIARFESKFINGMLQRGYECDFAQRCFNQLRGFSEYGFPESHAASFALIVYVSAWLKHHHPAAFAAALLNSQPMGFYAPAQIVRDAQDHGVEVRPVDVNHSEWDCMLEREDSLRLGVRLGMRLVKGMRHTDADRIAAVVKSHGSFRSVESLHRASGCSAAALKRLASADAFTSMGLDRQAALWHVRALRDGDAPIFDDAPPDADSVPALPCVTPHAKVMHDYASIGLSLKAHPISFLRGMLNEKGATPACELADAAIWRNGKRIAVAGLALVRQRPATASGVVFITLEDETGVANLIIRPKIFERYRRAARHGIVILARGTIEREGDVVHVMANHLESLDDHVADMGRRSRDFH